MHGILSVTGHRPLTFDRVLVGVASATESQRQDGTLKGDAINILQRCCPSFLQVEFNSNSKCIYLDFIYFYKHRDVKMERGFTVS